MKAEIILTDNNINIDLNEPTIDVSTEDGFSVTIIGGVGPQGNRGPEGPKGENGDDYVLTEEDKDDIAGLAAEKVDLTNYVKKTDYATTSAAGVVKVGGLGVKMSNGELVLAPASSRQMKIGSGDTAPIIAAKEHEAVFYGLAKAAGDETQKASNDPVGTYTDEAKIAIREMIGAASPDDIPDAPVQDVQIDGVSIVQEGVAAVPIATTSKLGVVKAGNGLYMQGGSIHLNAAPEFILKRGDVTTAPVVSSNQHIGVFYGLTKAAGVDMASSANPVGTYTDEAKAAIQTMLEVPAKSEIPEVPVQDVQINGTSIINESGIANVPIADSGILGAVRINTKRGVGIFSDGTLAIVCADTNDIRGANSLFKPITTAHETEAVFYSLAYAAGATDQQASENPVGQYTDNAKLAIRTMLGLDDASIVDIVQEGLPAVEGVSW